MHQEATLGCTGKQRMLMKQRLWLLSPEHRTQTTSPGSNQRQQNQQLSLWPGVDFNYGTKESGPAGEDQAGYVSTPL